MTPDNSGAPSERKRCADCGQFVDVCCRYGCSADIGEALGAQAVRIAGLEAELADRNDAALEEGRSTWWREKAQRAELRVQELEAELAEAIWSENEEVIRHRNAAIAERDRSDDQCTRLAKWNSNQARMIADLKADNARMAAAIKAVEELVGNWFECGSGEFHYADAAMELHAALTTAGASSAGQPATAAEPAPVPDLMENLRQSLREAKARRAAATPTEEAADGDAV